MRISTADKVLLETPVQDATQYFVKPVPLQVFFRIRLSVLELEFFYTFQRRNKTYFYKENNCVKCTTGRF